MGIRYYLYLRSKRRLVLLSFSHGFTFKENYWLSFSKQMTTDIIVQALKNAYVSQRPKDKVILHTDLGSQYTSQDFKNLTSELNIIQSFSRKGCPYDNACIESFHATLKKEEVIKPHISRLNKLE